MPIPPFLAIVKLYPHHDDWIPLLSLVFAFLFVFLTSNVVFAALGRVVSELPLFTQWRPRISCQVHLSIITILAGFIIIIIIISIITIIVIIIMPTPSSSSSSLWFAQVARMLWWLRRMQWGRRDHIFQTTPAWRMRRPWTVRFIKNHPIHISEMSREMLSKDDVVMD